jgi:asparagine synthase (glutamine-hydrolysing)
MCGFYITNKDFSNKVVIEKVNSIKFRGPDYTGFKKIGDISMAHVRLSIIDLNKRSNQPMSFVDSHIVFNGEIYNYREIRDELINKGINFETESDTEVLLKGYRFFGVKILDKLNGMFSFAIFDKKNDQIFCARDRTGQAPFFYTFEKGIFEISSQLRPLINPKSKVSSKSVSFYLDLGYVPSPYSIIKNVKKLAAGNYLIIDNSKNNIEIKQYWDLKKVKTIKISYNSAKSQLKELLKDAIKIRMNSDVPMAFFLSGGIDSSLITSMATELVQDKINTFSVGFSDPKFDESKLSKKFSKILKTNHYETVCNSSDILSEIKSFSKVYDEPFSDSSALPSLLLNRMVKNHATVALSGDGGDESFLGYNQFDLARRFNYLLLIPLFIRKLISKLNWHSIIKSKKETIREILNSEDIFSFSLKFYSVYDSIQKIRDQSWKKLYFKYKDLSNNSIQQMADLNIKLWLENDSNVKVDRASKAYAVEVRSPFLDYRIIEFARSLPVNFRYKKGDKKYILKDLLEEYIPKDTFDVPKKGFSIPLKKWLKNDLKDDILEKLNDNFFDKIPNFNKEKFKKQLSEHMLGKYDHSTNIWKIYILSLWYEEFNF